MKIHLQCKWHSPIACKWYSPIASNHTAISSHTKFLEEVQTHTFTQDTIIAYLLHNVEGTVLWAVLTSVWFMWGAWKSQNTIHSYNSHPLSVSVMQAGVTCTSFCNYTAWKWQLEKKNSFATFKLCSYKSLYNYELCIRAITVNQNAKVAPGSLYIEDCSCLLLWRHVDKSVRVGVVCFIDGHGMYICSTAQ